MKGLFDEARVPYQEQTWTAGDKRTQDLGLALKRQLSAPGDAAKGLGTARSGRSDAAGPSTGGDSAYMQTRASS